MATKVISVKGRKDKDYMYVGRRMFTTHAESKFHNPYKVGSSGVPDVETAVYMFYMYITKPENAALLAEVETLKGKVLGCWCKNVGHELCHGDVLVYLTDHTLTPTLRDLFVKKGIAFDPACPIIDDWGGATSVRPAYHFGGLVPTPQSSSASEIPTPSVTIETVTNHLQEDRVQGMLIGAALGDALGVPHEFPSMGTYPYTGKLQHEFTLKFFRASTTYTLGVGQYSDDTEMMLCILRSLVHHKSYNARDVRGSYIEWAATNQPMMGSNTRDLIKGSSKGKAIQYVTYEKHFEKKFGIPLSTPPFTLTTEAAEAAQSNGALMRCMPLACLSVDETDAVCQKAIDEDVWSTNPSSVARQAETLYLMCMRKALMGVTAEEIYKFALSFKDNAAIGDSLRAMLADVENNVGRDLNTLGGRNVKGWCITSLYTALMCLRFRALHDTPYEDAIGWVINCGGDTDTNACIAGGLLGALTGYQGLAANKTTYENIAIMGNSTLGVARTGVPRPPKFQLGDIFDLAHKLYELGGVKQP